MRKPPISALLRGHSGGSGYSQDTPLARWYTAIRSQRLVDGPDEVHRWTVGRNVIKAYQQFGTTGERRRRGLAVGARRQSGRSARPGGQERVALRPVVLPWTLSTPGRPSWPR